MMHPVGTRLAARCAAAALLSAVAFAAVAQENPAPGAPAPVPYAAPPAMSAMSATQKITMMNAVVEQIRKFLWQAQTSSFSPAKDSRGRTFKDDINEYL